MAQNYLLDCIIAPLAQYANKLLDDYNMVYHTVDITAAFINEPAGKT